jgi:putative hydrolase of the HAD superfamily
VTPKTPPRSRIRQSLLFDGDDTLWENNVYFERAIDDFVAYLDHSTLAPAEVRAVLDEIERANVRMHGYGALSFGRSLRECYEHLHQRHLDETELTTVMGFAERILSQPIEVIAGVEETLADLATRHDLALLTKGHDEEQRLKIERSGLEDYFTRAFVVPEKDVGVYVKVVEELSVSSERAWMIGNSPRSDVNPALAAGLNAVFIPHDQTWRLEHEEVASAVVPRRLLVVQRFAELRDHF